MTAMLGLVAIGLVGALADLSVPIWAPAQERKRCPSCGTLARDPRAVFCRNPRCGKRLPVARKTVPRPAKDSKPARPKEAAASWYTWYPDKYPTPRARMSARGNIEMVVIPAGEFTMGSSKSQFGPDEEPVRRVYLDSYSIGKNVVTVGQFRAYCQATGINFNTFWEPRWQWKDDHPMVYVSWQEARDYCRWAGGDLPTEAQWEKASRGTDGREYPWGGTTLEWSRIRAKAQSTAAVGSYSSGASPYGCLDMAGNVDQWTRSRFGPYDSQPNRNPEGSSSGPWRVLRGGSWADGAQQYFRCPYRSYSKPDYRSGLIGFRLAGPP